MTNHKTSAKFSTEVRERAVRMVLEHRGEHTSQWAAIVSISGKLGMTAETVRKWVRQAEIDGGARSGVSSVAAHPGWAATELQSHTESIQDRVMGLANRLIAQSAAMGALPTLYAATVPDADPRRTARGCAGRELPPRLPHLRAHQGRWIRSRLRE